MTTTTVTVKGMTCEHCVKSVTEELTKIEGVTDVDVALSTGQVTITSASGVDSGAIADAVDEAGFELVESSS